MAKISKSYHNRMMAEAKDKQSKCKHDYLTIMGNTVCRKCGKFKDD